MSNRSSASAFAQHVRALVARRPAVVPLAALAVGLAVGWFGLGWALFPVVWTDASPADLAPPLRRDYVQLVADAYGGTGDLGAARSRVSGLDATVLAEDLTSLVQGTETDAAQRAAALAQALEVPVSSASAPTVASEAAGPGVTAPTASAEPAAARPAVLDMTRTAALLALVAALAAGLALAWGYVRWRRAPVGGDARPVSPGGPPTAGVETTRGRGAPPWRPQRIDLGDRALARYRADDERFYQTWLVYDERGGLVGGAGLQAHPVGSINALDLWFFKREDEHEDADTPVVTLVSQAAYDDGVFRARLGDRTVVPAVPGTACVLEAADLALGVHIEAVEPDPSSEQLGLSALTLALTPRRIDRTAEPDEPDPPVPLLFRRD